jgi:hypothetical protein
MRLPKSFDRTRRAGAALIGLLALLVGLLPPLAAPTAAASDFYRTEIRDGRWWFVRPNGDVTFSMGVNYVTPAGMTARDRTNPYRAVMEAKYGKPVNQAARSTAASSPLSGARMGAAMLTR